MKLLADVHISPRTVTFLRELGHDVVRVGPDYLRSTASDADIVAEAITDERIIVTQDVDFSALVALSGSTRPSVVLLRLVTAKVEVINEVLERALPMIEPDLAAGALVTVEEHQVRVRRLPVA
jgi:predicted nuclease of predicted toxin-antitoxin system